MQVLIVKLTSMGDLIQALPAVTDAAAARPEVRFDWVVDEAFAEIPAWHPAVGRIIETAHRRWRSNLPTILFDGQLGAFLGKLRSTRYDAVIDAQTNLKSALVTALCRGPKHGPDRASAREYPAHWAYRHRYAIPVGQLAIERWRQLFAMVLDYPLPRTAPDFGLAGTAWPDTPNEFRRPYIVAVTNASWDNKYWLDSHWRTLIGIAARQGFEVVLTSGSELEYERSRRIADGLGNARVLARRPLTDMAAILRGSRGAICMDTGLAHLAAALGVPTVTLYGPTDPALIGATGPRSRHIVATGYDCIPCYRRICAVPGYRGTQAQCLRRIGPEQVWDLFAELGGHPTGTWLE